MFITINHDNIRNIHNLLPVKGPEFKFIRKIRYNLPDAYCNVSCTYVYYYLELLEMYMAVAGYMEILQEN